jgi:hypothetical protein
MGALTAARAAASIRRDSTDEEITTTEAAATESAVARRCGTTSTLRPSASSRARTAASPFDRPPDPTTRTAVPATAGASGEEAGEEDAAVPSSSSGSGNRTSPALEDSHTRPSERSKITPPLEARRRAISPGVLIRTGAGSPDPKRHTSPSSVRMNVRSPLAAA